MVLCSSCDGVLLKFKKKKGGPLVYQHRLFELSIDPSNNSLDNPLVLFFPDLTTDGGAAGLLSSTAIPWSLSQRPIVST
jgi:hypothetical protein